MTDTQEWKVIDGDAGVLTAEYSFGGGKANTFVVRIGEGNLLAVSPATNMSDETLTALERFGKPVALVAPNGYHWLGLEAWHKRWPDARIFAPEKAGDRISKKAPHLGRIEPLAALERLLPPTVSVFEGPHMKIPDTFVRVDAPRGSIWYVNDLLANLVTLPESLLFRTLTRLTNSGPGFRVSRVASWLLVGNKAAFKEWFVGALRSHPPVVLVPGHGAVVEGADAASTADLVEGSL